MKKTLFAIIIPILFGAPLAYAATILLTQSSDSLNTGRTNTNTSLTNLNAAFSNGTSTEPSMAKYYVATSTLIASQLPYASTTAITASGSICIGSTCYSSIPLSANPTVSVGLSAVNGSASTFLRSDAAPALDQTIVPTMTGLWAFANTGTTTFSGGISSGTKIAAPYFNATSSTATSTFNGGIKSPCFSNDGIACITSSSLTGSGSANQLTTWSGTSALTGSAELTFSSNTLVVGSASAGLLRLDNGDTGTGLTIQSSNAPGSFTATLPSNTGTVGELNLAQTWSALQTITNASTTNFTATYASSTNMLASVNLTVGATTTPWAALSLVSATNPTFAVATTSGALPTFLVNSSGGIQVQAWQPSTSTAITLDWNITPPQVEYQIGNAATSITVINATTTAQWGSRKLVWVCNVGGTAGALTWKGVEWIGVTAPTQTTTSNACDAYSFDITRATSTTAYKVSGSGGSNFQ